MFTRTTVEVQTFHMLYLRVGTSMCWHDIIDLLSDEQAEQWYQVIKLYITYMTIVKLGMLLFDHHCFFCINEIIYIIVSDTYYLQVYFICDCGYIGQFDSHIFNSPFHCLYYFTICDKTKAIVDAE